jgi:hypothetical protein
MKISPEHFLDLAKLEFLSLRDLEKPETGDRYFAKYGVGNTPEPDRAFERFAWYETLLSVLRSADENRYRTLHKGPAFYFLEWTAFHMRSCQKAVFYMDAALSEDIRKTIEAIRVEQPDIRQSYDALV